MMPPSSSPIELMTASVLRRSSLCADRFVLVARSSALCKGVGREMRNAGRSNFTLFPNMIDDLKLSVHAFRLYVHIARVVGSGWRKCTQGTRLMADICNMSMASVSKAKRELVELGLIEVKKIPTPNGIGDEISLVDIWTANNDIYQSNVADDAILPTTQFCGVSYPHSSCGELDSSSGEEHSSQDERNSSPDERRKKQIKDSNKNLVREQQAQLAARARFNNNRTKQRERRTPIQKDFQLTDSMLLSAQRKFPGLNIEIETDLFVARSQAHGRKSANWERDLFGYLRATFNKTRA